jgi:hypothetical protein
VRIPAKHDWAAYGLIELQLETVSTEVREASRLALAHDTEARPRSHKRNNSYRCGKPAALELVHHLFCRGVPEDALSGLRVAHRKKGRVGAEPSRGTGKKITIDRPEPDRRPQQGWQLGCPHDRLLDGVETFRAPDSERVDLAAIGRGHQKMDMGVVVFQSPSIAGPAAQTWGNGMRA